jgi:hypothetical protein
MHCLSAIHENPAPLGRAIPVQAEKFTFVGIYRHHAATGFRLDIFFSGTQHLMHRNPVLPAQRQQGRPARDVRTAFDLRKGGLLQDLPLVETERLANVGQHAAHGKAKGVVGFHSRECIPAGNMGKSHV